MARGYRSLAMRSALLAGAGLLLAPGVVESHEVPARVTVLAYVRPVGRVLRMVVRVPLEAMRDLELPVRGPGYLDIAAAQPQVEGAARLWIADYLRVFEEGRALGRPAIVAARVSLPSDRAFDTWAGAEAHVTGPPLPLQTDLVWNQAMLDVILDYAIVSESARFSIDPMLAHLGVETRTVLHFVTGSGTERVYQYTGNPGVVRLDPRWHQATWQFVVLGFEHIMDGLDRLLFILCLVIPVRRLRPLVGIVTAFTVAHSITLIAAANGVVPSALWFPPLVEAAIAFSIVFMAFENIVGARLGRRWMVAFGFGLVHGLGFSFVLQESMQFAGRHLVSSLVAFNVGIEAGQLAVILVVMPALAWLYRRVAAERMGTILLSALVAHTGWHWMVERGSQLRAFAVDWPEFDAALLASLMRGTMVLLVAGGALWATHGFVAWLERPLDGGGGRRTFGDPDDPHVTAAAGRSDPAGHPRGEEHRGRLQ